jgi:hypothetical protein
MCNQEQLTYMDTGGILSSGDNVMHEALPSLPTCLHSAVFRHKDTTLFTGKSKDHPTKGHEGPEWEQKHSSILSLTLALDGGGWSMPHHSHFTPGKDQVHIVEDARWAPGLFWITFHRYLYLILDKLIKHSSVTSLFSCLSNTQNY